MRKVLVTLGVLALASCLLALAPPHESVSASTTRTGTLASYTKIKHVVIIYQENHTFDDVLGSLCATRPQPCNGYVGPVTMADGITAENPAQPDIIPVIAHDPDSQQLGMDNKWDQVPGCTTAPYWCISHVDPANMPNLTRLANTYTVSDATFAAGHAASFGAHVTLAAGTFDGFAGYNPVPSRTGHKPGNGWGCDSYLDDLWGPKHHLTYQPSCIPDQKGRGPYRRSKVPYVPTIMERLESAGLTWHIYEGDHKERPSETGFSVCTYFWWCYSNRWNIGYNSAKRDFVDAGKNGTLPTLSLVIPNGKVSQHNLTSMAVGDSYIGELVSAVEKGPEWDSTAIFITYDDCGCFYDHVVPPDKSLGLRNPMVIVSPWAKPQGTDSTVAVQPYSMLSFVQRNFGLSSLSPNVDQAYDYANAFDFSQRPLPGIPMTTQPISEATKQEVARLAHLWADDPA